mgnify:CR=1 FL=1
MSKNNIVLKNAELKTKSKLKKLVELIQNIDIDFVLVFLILIAFINIKWYFNLLASIGITYWYKKIVKDILVINSMRKK